MPDAADANDAAHGIFARISEEVRKVSDAMEEIDRGLTEVSSGTEEIMRGVQSSVASTGRLKEGVGSVDARIAEAVGALAELTAASSRALENLESVRDRFTGLAAEAARVSEIGANNEAGLKRLSDSLANR
jgi:methyl-accepting chemotaxis protein